MDSHLKLKRNYVSFVEPAFETPPRNYASNNYADVRVRTVRLKIREFFHETDVLMKLTD